MTYIQVTFASLMLNSQEISCDGGDGDSIGEASKCTHVKFCWIDFMLAMVLLYTTHVHVSHADVNI